MDFGQFDFLNFGYEGWSDLDLGFVKGGETQVRLIRPSVIDFSEQTVLDRCVMVTQDSLFLLPALT